MDESITIDPNDEDQVAIWRVLEKLVPSQQTVLVYRFGLFGKEAKSLPAIGKLMNISGERVRQLEGAALDRMRSVKLKRLVEKIRHPGIVKAVYGVLECGCVYNREMKLWLLGKAIICNMCLDRKQVIQ